MNSIIDIRDRLPRKGTQANPHKIESVTKVIIHHDAQFRPEAYDDLTRYSQQASYHIGRGEDGMQYHYKISNLGDVYLCRTLTDTLWHAANYPVNLSSIAICLDGNFEEQLPTREQLRALKDLLENLCTQHPEFPADKDDVFAHREVSLQGTACPGRNLIDYIIKYRTTGNILVDVPANPTIEQDPVKKAFWKVYDFNGTQVGAYSTPENAQNRLNSMEAGTIKNPEGTTIVTKEKPVVVVTPPFKDETPPQEVPESTPTTSPEAPEEPKSDEVDPQPSEEPVINNKKEENPMKNETLRKLTTGAGIAILGAVATFLQTEVSSVDFGQFTPIVVAVNSVIVNAIRLYIKSR